MLRNYLAEQGLVKAAITKHTELSPGEPAAVVELFEKFPHGVVQPAVLCIKPDRTVLYSWATTPTKVGSCENIGLVYV